MKVCWKPGIAGLVMGGFIVLVNPHGRVAVVSVTALAAVIYALMLVILRTADEEERTIIRRALRLRSTRPGQPS